MREKTIDRILDVQEIQSHYHIRSCMDTRISVAAQLLECAPSAIESVEYERKRGNDTQEYTITLENGLQQSMYVKDTNWDGVREGVGFSLLNMLQHRNLRFLATPRVLVSEGISLKYPLEVARQKAVSLNDTETMSYGHACAFAQATALGDRARRNMPVTTFHEVIPLDFEELFHRSHFMLIDSYQLTDDKLLEQSIVNGRKAIASRIVDHWDLICELIHHAEDNRVCFNVDPITHMNTFVDAHYNP